jgi:hypothetical protein
VTASLNGSSRTFALTLVPPAPPPSAPEPDIYPRSGAGWSSTFIVSATDNDGYANIKAARLLFNTAPLLHANACSIEYNRATQTIALRNDAGTGWVSPGFVPIAGGVRLANSRCAVEGAGGAQSQEGLRVQLTLPLTFFSSFSGRKNIYVWAEDNQQSSDPSLSYGYWTVPDPSCTASLSPGSQDFAPKGGTGSVAVTTTAGCAWAATSNQSWARITSAASGAGSGTVTFTVDPNSTGSARTATLTIAGVPFGINQAAGPRCTESVQRE